MSAPTPGPWTVRREHEMLPGEIWTENDARGGCRRFKLASFHGMGPESAANANLAAAAPDLLAALLSAPEWPDDADPFNRDAAEAMRDSYESWLSNVRAVVAKAEGRP